jgi:FKBP-type peptidyl-prolyl cis-trans isomerase FklB
MKIFKFLLIPTVLFAIVFTGCKPSTKSVSVKSDVDSMSYALGINYAARMMQGDIKNINALAFAKGLEAGFSEKEGVMTNEQAIEFLNNYFSKLTERVAKENLELGEKFLAENAKKEGVVVDSSGLQYKVLVEGTGAKPLATDMVKVNYHGTRIDGSVFDSSVDRGEPFQTRLNQVIKGWTLGVTKMSVGSKYILYIPSSLAYGANPRPGPVKPNDVLIFEVELLEIIKEETKK